jgi:hypothetical protein
MRDPFGVFVWLVMLALAIYMQTVAKDAVHIIIAYSLTLWSFCGTGWNMSRCKV